MEQYLPPRAEGDTRGLQPRVVEYLTTILERGDRSLGVRNSRELRSLAQAVDSLIRGDITFAADTLIQRFKAVELSAAEGGWNLAQHLELIPGSKVSSVSDRERQWAVDAELRNARLHRTPAPALTDKPSPADPAKPRLRGARGGKGKKGGGH